MFELSDYILRLILLLIPGIFGHYLIYTIIGRKVKKDWEDLVEIFIISIVSYFLYSALFYSIGFIIKLSLKEVTYFDTSIVKAFLDENIAFKIEDIIFSSIIAIFVSLGLAKLSESYIINEIAVGLNISSRIDNEDIWDFFIRRNKNEWVYVRDFKKNLVYYGHLIAYSESFKKRELVLGDVSVHDNKVDKKYYDLKEVYISLDFHDISIELPKSLEIKEKGNEKKRGKEKKKKYKRN